MTVGKFVTRIKCQFTLNREHVCDEDKYCQLYIEQGACM